MCDRALCRVQEIADLPHTAMCAEPHHDRGLVGAQPPVVLQPRLQLRERCSTRIRQRDPRHDRHQQIIGYHPRSAHRGRALGSTGDLAAVDVSQVAPLVTAEHSLRRGSRGEAADQWRDRHLPVIAKHDLVPIHREVDHVILLVPPFGR